MRKTAFGMCFVFFCCCMVLAQAPRATAKSKASAYLYLPPAAIAALETINPERIRAHVRFLAHDLLEGRGTGQRGGDIAAEYIGTQFALYGLKPAGDNGSYLQKVPMVGIQTQPDSTYSLIPAKGEPLTLRGKDDIVAMDETGDTSTTIDAPIVWMGYGIDAPEYNWNDYKDVDVKGKVLLMMVNEPPSDDPKFFGGKALTYYGRWTYKYEEATRRGAKAVLIIHTTETAGYPYSVVRKLKGAQIQRTPDSPALAFAGWLSAQAGDKLLASVGLTVDQALK